MNDRYLFKGKQVLDKNKEWVRGTLTVMQTADGEVTHIYTGMAGFKRVDPDTVSQCIGRKDMNGALIYENDIISIHCEIDDEPPVEEYLVIYYDYKLCSYFGRSNETDMPVDLDFDFNDCEVVGNRFDNPDLYKKIVNRSTAIKKKVLSKMEDK